MSNVILLQFNGFLFSFSSIIKVSPGSFTCIAVIAAKQPETNDSGKHSNFEEHFYVISIPTCLVFSVTIEHRMDCNAYNNRVIPDILDSTLPKYTTRINADTHETFIHLFAGQPQFISN